MNNVMDCPKCGRDSILIESTINEDCNIVRRYKCLRCGFQYNTVEMLEEAGVDE